MAVINSFTSAEVVKDKEEEGEFSSKAQIMTLMTTDCDRVCDFSWHFFTLTGTFLICHALPISVGLIMVKTLLSRLRLGRTFCTRYLVCGYLYISGSLTGLCAGVSCFIGLVVTCLFLPMNHFAGKFVIVAQDNLMKARDERVSLMNEILAGIRMLKVFIRLRCLHMLIDVLQFMAWERSFEKRVLKIREKELYFQRRNYIIEVSSLYVECVHRIIDQN